MEVLSVAKGLTWGKILRLQLRMTIEKEAHSGSGRLLESDACAGIIEKESLTERLGQDGGCR
jgi:hypothetical protein